LRSVRAPNVLELSKIPRLWREAARRTQAAPPWTLRPTGGRFKQPLKASPPGQSHILVVCQGFSELLGGLLTLCTPLTSVPIMLYCS